MPDGLSARRARAAFATAFVIALAAIGASVVVGLLLASAIYGYRGL